jgi:hypothetical protein
LTNSPDKIIDCYHFFIATGRYNAMTVSCAWLKSLLTRPQDSPGFRTLPATTSIPLGLLAGTRHNFTDQAMAGSHQLAVHPRLILTLHWLGITQAAGDLRANAEALLIAALQLLLRRQDADNECDLVAVFASGQGYSKLNGVILHIGSD